MLVLVNRLFIHEVRENLHLLRLDFLLLFKHLFVEVGPLEKFEWKRVELLSAYKLNLPQELLRQDDRAVNRLFQAVKHHPRLYRSVEYVEPFEALWKVYLDELSAVNDLLKAYYFKCRSVKVYGCDP